MPLCEMCLITSRKARMSDKIKTSPNTAWNDKLYRENYDKIFKPKRESWYDDMYEHNKKVKVDRYLQGIADEVVKIAKRRGIK
jgi:hypothetical protein